MHLRRHLFTTLLFVLPITIAMPATAKGKSKIRVNLQVVGNFQFEGKTLVDMALTTGGARRYLYVQHSKDEGVSILDVTDPMGPRLLATTFWPEGAELGSLTFLGDYAIGDVLPNGHFLQDRSVPSHISFIGVRRVIGNRGIVYVLSDAGLSILKTSSARW